MFRRMLSFFSQTNSSHLCIIPSIPARGRQRMEEKGGEHRWISPRELRSGKLGRGRDDLNQARALVFLPETVWCLETKPRKEWLNEKKVQNVRSEYRIYITTIKWANHVSFVRASYCSWLFLWGHLTHLRVDWWLRRVFSHLVQKTHATTCKWPIPRTSLHFCLGSVLPRFSARWSQRSGKEHRWIVALPCPKLKEL